ncbi:unnamed protein product [Ambrosiozyma monospora]|uniref:Unnamed protein product n=1 Tax=Ambrosiozyma monospora TaxID=43982 RepID=A0A9W6YYE6_AMBMO|nr:unnamed protein product [Ambrosiozyma monospora]
MPETNISKFIDSIDINDIHKSIWNLLPGEFPDHLYLDPDERELYYKQNPAAGMQDSVAAWCLANPGKPYNGIQYRRFLTPEYRELPYSCVMIRPAQPRETDICDIFRITSTFSPDIDRSLILCSLSIEPRKRELSIKFNYDPFHIFLNQIFEIEQKMPIAFHQTNVDHIGRPVQIFIPNQILDNNDPIDNATTGSEVLRAINDFFYKPSGESLKMLANVARTIDQSLDESFCFTFKQFAHVYPLLINFKMDREYKRWSNVKPKDFQDSIFYTVFRCGHDHEDDETAYEGTETRRKKRVSKCGRKMKIVVDILHGVLLLRTCDSLHSMDCSQLQKHDGYNILKKLVLHYHDPKISSVVHLRETILKHFYGCQDLLEELGLNCLTMKRVHSWKENTRRRAPN